MTAPSVRKVVQVSLTPNELHLLNGCLAFVVQCGVMQTRDREHAKSAATADEIERTMHRMGMATVGELGIRLCNLDAATHEA